MDLFDMLFPGPERSSVGVHVFYAAIVDYVAGYTTRAQIIGALGLTDTGVTQLDILLSAVDGLGTLAAKLSFGEQLHAVMVLAESGRKYTTKQEFAARLGL